MCIMTRNGRRINAKSIMGVMMLAAGMGSDVEIETDGGHGLRLVGAIGLDLYVAAHAGRQHHHTHDALGIDAPAVAGHMHIAREATGQLGQLGRRAGVQAQPIADRDAALVHRQSGNLRAWFCGREGPTCIAPCAAPAKARATRLSSGSLA